jgi:hypothetical protein
MKTVDFASQGVLGKTDRLWSISAQRKTSQVRTIILEKPKT